MKTLISSALVFIVVTLGAFAQEKLWTWKAPRDHASRVLHAAAVGADGSAAFVLGEIRSGGKMNYRLVWVSNQGKVLANSKIATQDFDGVFQPGWGTTWEIAVVSKKKLMVNDHKTIRIYTATNGGFAGLPKRVPTGHSLVFPGPSTAGWIEPQGTMEEYSYGEDGGPGEYLNVERMSFWKP